jgi:uncharacterized protein
MNPTMISAGALIGLLAGTLVGLTGIGGGLLLMPLLISVLGVPPIVAVGSDAVISCVTKIGAGGVHWYHGNVRWPLVLRLASGSIPGACAGVFVLARIRGAYGSAVNDFLRVVIGALLVVIPIVYLAGQYFSAADAADDAPSKTGNRFGVTIIGFFAGFLVGLTSIGAGSIILIMLLIFYGLPPVATVGTDVVHGALLAAVTGFLQFKLLRNVDLTLAGSVLAGSIPGSILGVYLTRHISTVALKRILCTLLVAVGARMLWGVLQPAS